MSWLIYTIIAISFFVLTNLLLRLVASKSRNPRASTLVFNLYGTLFALIIFLLESPSFTLPRLTPRNLLT